MEDTKSPLIVDAPATNGGGTELPTLDAVKVHLKSDAADVREDAVSSLEDDVDSDYDYDYEVDVELDSDYDYDYDVDVELDSDYDYDYEVDVELDSVYDYDYGDENVYVRTSALCHCITA